eukprot:g3248.t1
MPLPLLLAAGAAGGWIYKVCRFTDDEQTPEAERAARDAAFQGLRVSRDPLGCANWLFLRKASTFESHPGFSNAAQVVRWELMIDGHTHFVKVVHGHVSGKRRIYVDDARIHESRDVLDTGISQPFPPETKALLGGCALTLHIIENFDEEGDWLYDLEVNGERLMTMSERRWRNRNTDGMQLTPMTSTSSK